MIDEYINKNTALTKLCEKCPTDSDECLLVLQTPCEKYKEILHLPGEHVKPIIEAEWEEIYDDKDDPLFRHKFYCSACGDWQTYGITRYCPNCGAKMFDRIPQPSEPRPIVDDVEVIGVYNVAEGTVTYYHQPPDFFR